MCEGMFDVGRRWKEEDLSFINMFLLLSHGLADTPL